MRPVVLVVEELVAACMFGSPAVDDDRRAAARLANHVNDTADEHGSGQHYVPDHDQSVGT
jgi:hypothetical protein